jgi:hypothetical protein
VRRRGSDTLLVRPALRTPRAAAIAGILFSVLLAYVLSVLRLSIPDDPRDIGWLATSPGRVSTALTLLPVAGVAFMWFLGVLRDRLGVMEGRFFATVFLGSGLLFLGMIFVAAAGLSGLALVSPDRPDALPNAATLAFGRAFAYEIMRTYAFKMASVFMISTCTIILRTRIGPKWVAWIGYASAVSLLFGSGYLDWMFFLFPAWILVLSTTMLLASALPEADCDPPVPR